MTSTPVLVDLGPENFQSLPCCGVKNTAHPGRAAKNCWLQRYFKKGLRARVLVTPDGRQCGYVEYLPGEYAWRGVDARGYMFIHCVWTYFRQYQHKGLGGLMVRAAIDDAAQAGMNGVAVLARGGPWLASPELFLAHGFVTVDSAPPDYTLLALKLNPSAASPTLKPKEQKNLDKYGAGLVVVRSDQCPHTLKFASDIVRIARDEFQLDARTVELKSSRDAQNAPTPYAVFAVIRDGRLLADHQISGTRFRNIMRKEVSGPAGKRKPRA